MTRKGGIKLIDLPWWTTDEDSDGHQARRLVKRVVDKCCRGREAPGAALDLSLELLIKGEGASLDECLDYEYEAAKAAIRHPDFVEGIRSVLVDKDRSPSWLPRARAA